MLVALQSVTRTILMMVFLLSLASNAGSVPIRSDQPAGEEPAIVGARRTPIRESLSAQTSIRLLVMQDTLTSDGLMSGFTDTLVFGIDAGATFCLDPSLGEEELPPYPPVGVFDARFTDLYAAVPCIGQGLRVDYQPMSVNPPNEFGFTLRNAEKEGKSMRLRWDTAGVRAGWVSLLLTDDLALTVDMTAADSVLLSRFQYLNKYLYIRGIPRGTAPPRYAISATAGPGGSVTPAGTVLVDSSGTQSFSFSANPGYLIDSVFVDGAYVGVPPSWQFTNVVAPHSIFVRFRIRTYVIQASAGPGGVIAPSGSVVVTAGSNRSFSIAPDPGHGVDSLLVDGVVVPPVATYTFFNVLSAHTIRAVFRGAGVTADGIVSVAILQDTSATDNRRSGLADTLVFGIHPSATMCRDELLGEHELPPVPPSGVFDVRFTDDFLPVPCLGQGTSVNLQPYTNDPVSVFGFMLRAAEATGKEMVLRWDRSAVAADWDSLMVMNDLGFVVNMLAIDSAVFPRAQYLSRILYFRGGLKAVNFPTYTITASAGPGGSIQPSGSIPVDSGATQGFLLQPSVGYELDSVIVDGVPMPLTYAYTFPSVDRDHSIRAVYGPLSGEGALYRTLTFSDLTEKRQVKRKAMSYRFSFPIVNATSAAASGLGIWFGGTSKNLVHIDSTRPFVAAMSFDSRNWNFSGGSVAPGDTVWVSGVCDGASAVVLRWRWAYPSGASREGRFRTPFEPTGQTPLYPMPNGANVREEIFSRLGPAGLTVGIPHPEDALAYGWVRMKEGYRIRSSLLTNGRRHVAVGGCFTFRREKRMLTPTMEDNATFAALAILKANVTASALGITPAGLGELVYLDTVATRFNGLTVDEIGKYVDTLLAGRYVGAVRACEAPEAFAEALSVLGRINDAFAGPLDTVSFANALVLAGVRSAGAVGFLHHVAGSVPRVIDPAETAPIEMSPIAFSLAQNYPNPFNPTTTIEFRLPWDASVTLTVYNPLGQEVATLFRDDQLSEGAQQALFDGSSLGSGVYYYQLRAVAAFEEDDEPKPETLVATGKMLLVK
jgi:hypothetical protein